MPEGVVNIFNAICFIDYYPNLVSFIVFFMAYFLDTIEQS